MYKKQENKTKKETSTERNHKPAGFCECEPKSIYDFTCKTCKKVHNYNCDNYESDSSECDRCSFKRSGPLIQPDPKPNKIVYHYTSWNEEEVTNKKK